MKKIFLLSTALLVLSACSSNNSAPIENADGNLTPGMMMPVSSGTVGSAIWQPEIRQQSMPVSMSQPAYSSQTASNSTWQQTSQISQQQALVKQVTREVSKTVQKPISQEIVIPRDPHTKAPDYSKIDKGSYKACKYTVRKGDTMFLVAYISGIDVKELAAMNNMKEPYSLSIGQSLKTSSCTETITTKVTETAKFAEPQVTYTPAANGTQYGSDGSMTGPVKASVGTSTISAANVGSTTESVNNSQSNFSSNTSAATSHINWQWPTNGKIIQQFSSADGGNKGIDISGSRGQAINAVAPGTVVYAGDALRGYGNLIIIKHSDDFLSAYAHNDRILVKDQQVVKAGQQIAQMGSSGTDSVKLHFEIRYKGKSVNPINYLPRR